MIDPVSTTATTGTAASNPLGTAVRGVVAGQDPASAGGRTVSDRVDLSQTARLAAEYRANAGTDGKKPAEQLAESLKQAKSITDSFAAQLKGGRAGGTSATDFNAVVRDEVTSIMREGKPSDLIGRVVRRLFGG